MDKRVKITVTTHIPVGCDEHIKEGFYKKGNHYYKQTRENVLHVKVEDGCGCINHLHVYSLSENNYAGKETITEEEFTEKLREAVFSLGIHEYTK